jgi:hypothetical protein
MGLLGGAVRYGSLGRVFSLVIGLSVSLFTEAFWVLPEGHRVCGSLSHILSAIVGQVFEVNVG